MIYCLPRNTSTSPWSGNNKRETCRRNSKICNHRTGLLRKNTTLYRYSFCFYYYYINILNYYYHCHYLFIYLREREIFYLTMHSTHFIYGYMASDIWLRTILIVRKETRCRHIGYSYRLTARVLLYAPSHRQDTTYHGLCYTSRGALA